MDEFSFRLPSIDTSDLVNTFRFEFSSYAITVVSSSQNLDYIGGVLHNSIPDVVIARINQNPTGSVL